MALYFEAGYDLADLGTYAIDVVETGGNTFTASVSTGRYFLRTDAATATGDFASEVTDFNDFLGAVQDALNAETGSGTYFVSFSPTTERVTIAHTGGTVTGMSLAPNTLGGLLGHTGIVSGGLSLELQRVPDYWIKGSIGFSSAFHEREENEEVAFAAIAHSGRPSSVAKDGVATLLDLTAPLEEREKVYTRFASNDAPWTWQALYRHCRTVWPICVDDGTRHFLYLHEKAAAFDPRRISKDYVAHYDMELRTRLLGRL